METIWWDYTYDPVRREVTVRRWSQAGNGRQRLRGYFDGLTWDEAQDVMEVDAWCALTGRHVDDLDDERLQEQLARLEEEITGRRPGWWRRRR